MTAYHEPIELVRRAISDQGKTIKRKPGGGFMAQCPAHDDRSPSLSVDVGDDGRVLLKCFAGCTSESILESLQLHSYQLFPGNESASYSGSRVLGSSRTAPRRITAPPVATASHAIDTSRFVERSGPTTAYIYYSEDGETRCYEAVRKPRGSSKTFHFEQDGVMGLNGAVQIPYMLPLIFQRISDTVHIAEGQKDALRLAELGFLATDVHDGALTKENLQHFDGYHVIIHQDNDNEGQKKAGKRAAWLDPVAASVRVVTYDELPAKGDVSDYMEGHTVADLLQKINAAPLWEPEPVASDTSEVLEGWEEPVPLNRMEGPAFPVDAMPDPLRELVEAICEEMQVTAELVVPTLLSVISAAVCGKYEVRFEHVGLWKEPVHIMTMPIAPPASRKSPVISVLLKPVQDYEFEVQPAQRYALAQWESRLRILEKSLSGAESAAIKSMEKGSSISDSEARRMEAVDALETHRFQKPRVEQIVADDATPEAIKSLMFDNLGAISAISAESSLLSNTVGGRYSGGDPNLDVLKNGHAGDEIRVNRKGRGAEIVKRACLTVCVMVQPSVLTELGAAKGFIGEGVAARFLPSFSPDILGSRRIDVQSVPSYLLSDYSDVITRLLKRQPAVKDRVYSPWALLLSAEAAAKFREYRHWHERNMAPTGIYAAFREWAGKQEGAVLRIAGLLHAYQHTEPETIDISADAIDRAIRICDYFAAHASVMYRMLSQQRGDEPAQALLTAMLELGTRFTKRDLHRRVRNQVAFAKSTDLDSPLETLEELGYIRLSRLQVSGSGRPSIVIDLNPRAVPGARGAEQQPLESPFSRPRLVASRPVSTDGFAPRVVGEI